MKKGTHLTLLAGMVFALALGTMNLMAQQRGGGRFGQQGNFNPEEFRAQMMERMMQRYQEALNVSEDEWDAIKPLVADVVEKQQALNAANRGGGFGFGGRRGRGGDGGNDTQAQGGRGGRRGGFGQAIPEIEALQTALNSEDTSSDEIKAKLEALRQARQKLEADYQAACNKLRQVLTVRWEATFVMMGLLQ